MGNEHRWPGKEGNMEDNLDRISRGEGGSRRYNRVIDIRRFDQDKRDFVSVRGRGEGGEQRDVTSGPALSSPSYRMLDLVMVMLRGDVSA